MPRLLCGLMVWLVSSWVYAEALPADPTRPTHLVEQKKTVKKPTVRRNYSVNYIKKSASSSYAIINGQAVQEGQRVQGALVKSIGYNDVVIFVSGRTRTLTLGSGSEFKTQSKEE